MVEKVLENREAGLALKTRAILFRASHHSGPLEMELTQCNRKESNHLTIAIDAPANIDNTQTCPSWARGNHRSLGKLSFSACRWALLNHEIDNARTTCRMSGRRSSSSARVSEAAKALRRAPVELTVIDRQNHHCFQPLLYQVATAALSPADVAWPIRHILRKQKNTTVLMAEVRGIDTTMRRVQSTQ